MKKSLLVAALAAVLVIAFASSAFAYGPVWSGGTASPTNGFPNYNTYKVTSPGAVWTAADGGAYLRWSVAATYNPANTGSPHGNYASTTNKCQVCHAVHRADVNGTVLTAWDNSTVGTGDMAATSSCIFCHGASATFTSVRVQTGNATTVFALSPHGRCQRCHTPSPHGAGASTLEVLREKLINTSADAAIAADMGTNGLTADMFTIAGDPLVNAQGVTMGTGYLCTACHDNAADPVAFAVGTAGGTPRIAADPAEVSPVTGHRVLAMNTNTWNEAGEYGAYYSGTTDAAGDSTIAYNNANGCKQCHDASTAWGSKAFPHGYVAEAGARSSSSETSAAMIWMTFASNASGSDRAVASQAALGGSKNAALTTDGLCIKCHINAAGDAGVGITY